MIAANDAGILYSPFNWNVTATRAETITAGAYFRTLIVGNPASIALTFDVTGVSAPLPLVTVIIDGVRTTVEVAASVPVTIPTHTTWAKHELTVVVEATTETVNRWTTRANAVKFTGITTTGTASRPLERPRSVLVLGDSITEGVRTLNSTATTDVLRNSATECWAYQLGDALGAEVGVVGFGSTGVVKASGSGGVPNLAGFWNTMWSAGPSRGVTSAPPDWIVINHGTNDGASDVTAEYRSVLNAMIAATPAETVIICLEPFGGGDKGPQIQAAAAGTTVPARSVYVDTTGWWSTADASDGVHPYGYTAPDLAARAAAAAINVSSGAPPQPTVGYVFDFNGVPQPMATG